MKGFSPGRRRFLAWALRGAAASLGGYSALIEPSLLVTTKYDIPVGKQYPWLDGLRIGVAGDFHINGPRGRNMAQRVVERLMAEEPDLILLPGDFAGTGMDRVPEHVEAAAAILSQLSAALGVHAVPGNHEYFQGIDQVQALFESKGLHLMRNEHKVLDLGRGKLTLAGLDDGLMGLADSVKGLGGAPRGVPVLLLVHEPDVAMQVDAGGRDLVLQVSGHSHGGQVRAPLLGPLVLPPMAKRFPEGFYPASQTMHAIFTTTGVGTLFSVRMACPPETALLTLRAG